MSSWRSPRAVCRCDRIFARHSDSTNAAHPQRLIILGTNINVDSLVTYQIEAGKITYAGIYALLTGVMNNSSLLCVPLVRVDEWLTVP